MGNTAGTPTMSVTSDMNAPYSALLERQLLKAAMEILGHHAGSPRPPLGQLSERDLRELRALIEELAIPNAKKRGVAGVPS